MVLSTSSHSLPERAIADAGKRPFSSRLMWSRKASMRGLTAARSPATMAANWASREPVFAAESGDLGGELLLSREHPEEADLFTVSVRGEHLGEDCGSWRRGRGVVAGARQTESGRGVDDLDVLGHEVADRGDRLAAAVGAHQRAAGWASSVCVGIRRAWTVIGETSDFPRF